MKTDKHVISRRQILSTGIVSAGAVLLTGSRALASRCVATPQQAEGPFYPVSHRLEEDADLTWRHDRDRRAKGEVIRVTGQVTDGACQPVPRALVEIWQACASGRYDHPTDENPAALDDNFQYWGRTATDAQGYYSFVSIKPGAYPDGPDWIRPPHIHFKVHRRGYHELITQMYFAGEYYNEADRILQKLPRHEQERLIIAPQTRGAEPLFQFDLSLTRV